MSNDENATARTRRQALSAVGAGGAGLLAVGVLGGCSGGSSGSDGSATSVPSKIKGKVIAKTSEIPVGGGKVFHKWKIVVTQPKQGRFKAFSAVCTHQGCTVGTPENGVIKCPCHGSEFSAADGSVEHGPADEPLPEFTAKVQGNGIVVG